MNIPESAVEAAAIAMCNHAVADSWEHLSDANREWYRVQARVPLDAAASSIAAESVDK